MPKLVLGGLFFVAPYCVLYMSLLASRNWAGLGCSSEGLPLYHCDARENEHGEGQICFYFQELINKHVCTCRLLGADEFCGFSNEGGGSWPRNHWPCWGPVVSAQRNPGWLAMDRNVFKTCLHSIVTWKTVITILNRIARETWDLPSALK